MGNNKKLSTEQEHTANQASENSQHFLITSTNSRSDYQKGNNRNEENYNDDIIYQYNLDDWQG